MPKTVALIVAAGRGHRVGDEIPKQYLLIRGETVLRKTVSAFLCHPGIEAVRVVIHPDDLALYERAVAGLDLLEPVHGGASRQESVRLGLESLANRSPDHVLIHDAARPFVDAGVISRVIEALDVAMGAIPALPVSDTLKRADGEVISDTVDRSDFWRAQTPQGFRFPEILTAHREFAGRDLTDDAAVAEYAGQDVRIVAGDDTNTKITTRDDLGVENSTAGAVADVRTGSGFDVHRFGDGPGPITLLGVEIPFDHGLMGHSDADVAMHALTDALLGAIAEGDIGEHFPPTDPQWKGVASRVFLDHAVRLVGAAGGAITNVDVTIVCERPKIGPHKQAMKSALAGLLGIADSRVNVKATTTERLGFTGRGEGIAAQAVATVRF